MTHKSKGKNPEDEGPQTGDDWIALAKKRGAIVREGGKFTSVSTPKGKAMIAPGRERLDNWTRSNLRRWFRLLGLMLLAGAVILMFVLPYLRSII